MNNLLILILSLFLVQCSRVQTLNLESHSYSKRPRSIIWIQVAGFSEEHIPLLRFNVAETSFKTNLEQVDCVGKMWSFNLFELRPEASKSFLAQINGSKNIKGTCEDYGKDPAWSYLNEIGYDASILENAASLTQSLESASTCSNNKTLNLSKIRFWRMGGEVTGNKTFHYQDSPEQMRNSFAPGLYHDRSCQKGICYSTISNNFKSMWSMMTKDRQNSFILVRDFSFQNALKKKDISLAKEALLEIDKIVSIVGKEKLNETLVVITGAETMPIEFPLQGKEWSDFEKPGKNILYKNSTLLAPVLAKGAMAENFCGIFDESEFLKRIIYKPEGKVFSLDNINPFEI